MPDWPYAELLGQSGALLALFLGNTVSTGLHSVGTFQGFQAIEADYTYCCGACIYTHDCRLAEALCIVILHKCIKEGEGTGCEYIGVSVQPPLLVRCRRVLTPQSCE